LVIIAQALLQSSLSDLTLCSSLINHLGILSLNETLEDINTRDLRCVLVDCLRGEMEVLAKTKAGTERISWLERAKVSY
jgi:immunoglobulin-binding protein 1